MLSKIATLSGVNFSLDKRHAQRRSINLSFDASERRGRNRVLIFDLSMTGMRIQTSAMFNIGEKLDKILQEDGPVSFQIMRAAPDAIDATSISRL